MADVMTIIVWFTSVFLVACRRDLPEELRPQFQPKRVLPLQAADIAAWDLRNIEDQGSKAAFPDHRCRH
jgi:hypothetical protein